MHRAIQKYLEDPLAEEILNMNIKNGDTLLAKLDKEQGKIGFEISHAEPEDAAAEAGLSSDEDAPPVTSN